MFTVITNKKEFIFNPILEMNEDQLNNAVTDSIQLYGNTYRMYADDWKHHVHIKCTDHCDANCSFCIEQSERNNPQNTNRVIESTKNVLSELAMQGHLKTVSITGGEPTLFPLIEELVNLVNSYKLKLFSINTNGRYLNRIPKSFCGWVNISKHSINDKDVFNRDFRVTPEMIIDFKNKHKDAKVRLQCVLGVTKKMNTIGDIIDFIHEYRNVVDDFSFRNLIIENNETKVNELLFKFRYMLLENAEFVEQCIQDYYVYETFKMFGTTITLSWSNMKELSKYNESHDSNFLEEIIIHPDGTVSGSWNKKSLIIHKPENKEGNTFIPCKGIGCKNHCSRYVSNASNLIANSIVESVMGNCYSINSTIKKDYYGNLVMSCGSSISSC